ncbi:MAG: hypothetical protein AAFR98_08925 [Pseudomonadota bacterium]
MGKIFCSEHGDQDETFVCQHIVQSLEENKPYGFWWAQDSDQIRPDAWCTTCNEMVESEGGEWTERALDLAKVTLLCGKCYDQAKAINEF